ncbi:MAG: hypothetical protein C4570_05025 [Ammonifex sp.]|jgi:micrococcal nuclease|nr:MAG: hypothetical protein C4570_05025 [Ammonifex sp.]
MHPTRVVDGDTIHVDIAGKDETVRFIGVDTPETVHPTRGEEPFGREASIYTKEQLSGKDIYLKTDIQHRGKYGRLLAYVQLEQPGPINNDSIRARMFQRSATTGWVREAYDDTAECEVC